MNEWVSLAYVALTITWGIISYIKGVDDGREKQDKDIENIIVKALKRYQGGDKN